jgi:hypothetical protein
MVTFKGIDNYKHLIGWLAIYMSEILTDESFKNYYFVQKIRKESD